MKQPAHFLKQLSLFICFLCFTAMSYASLHKSLWPKWEVTNPLSHEVISHEEWQTFLDQCIVTNEEGINLVNYANLTQTDIDLLKQYVTRLSKVDIGNYNRSEQLAYWLNLYNALTVKLIADYYPVSSIQEINTSPGLFSVGPWGGNLITINETRLSLDEIHNHIIRPIWNDARTHYAISNATIGSPNLSKRAFRGNTLENQLNEAALTYINSLRGLQIVEGRLIISKIYEWYAEDFGVNEKDIIRHLIQFSNQPTKALLEEMQSVNAYMYNWHLNAAVTG